MSLVSAQGVSVAYDDAVVLSHVDFTVEPGEIVTVVGPNGSGKSTFLKVLIGAVRPSAGRVTRKPGLKVGYVPQKLAIDPSLPMTVERFMHLPSRRNKGEVGEALERVGVAHLAGRQLASLSGGQFQRVLLARAILGRPDVLMLDEPTQGLDQPGSADFYTLLENIRRDMGCAVVMVSHELHVVMSASDRVICLNRHICCQGAPEVVSSAPEYRALFGTGTHGALAIYRHEHDHAHDDCDHDCDHNHDVDREHTENA
ncbi:metal ABC transporter ATP-binding protein [Marimonas lutisalis]|uniref:metal ABC transporter ATP-binding protein n=1 Tax=Marimonas lutisalis TaxID=2545756 RepID=UPI0010F4BB63|nr:metal ABC transporter ATP-binding protein [Marimonas lutisalis]